MNCRNARKARSFTKYRREIQAPDIGNEAITAKLKDFSYMPQKAM
jgi:hypothetical protein